MKFPMVHSVRWKTPHGMKFPMKHSVSWKTPNGMKFPTLSTLHPTPSHMHPKSRRMHSSLSFYSDRSIAIFRVVSVFSNVFHGSFCTPSFQNEVELSYQCELRRPN
uniref:Uncharacterized protein n=1 Tax=Cacopsylla melanoneura TaxID=428564 RepID=A0A8D9EB94_9HEMI